MKPNIILFVAEDLDYEGINCYDAKQTGYTGVIRSGNKNFPNTYTTEALLTPTLDSIAKEGFMNTNYYCTSAICTPARYTILTGRYSERSPQFCQIYPSDKQANIYFNTAIAKNETIIPKVLKENGYQIGMVGKWHNFPQHIKLRLLDMNTAIPLDADPKEPGIKKALAEWYQFAVDYLKQGFGWDYVDRVYYDNPEPFHPKAIGCHNLEWIIEGALQFLDNNKDTEEPFFLYIPVTVPHSRYQRDIFSQCDPLSTPSGYLDKAPEGMVSRQSIINRIKSENLPDYAIEGLWLDEAVHAVLKKLKEIGKNENTCFILTTDHPTAGKETCHLGRIPFMAKWPGRIKPGTLSQTLLAEPDLAPTILDIAECNIPDDMQLDGKSFKPLLLGESLKSPRECALLEVTNSRGLVSGKWKYIANRLPDFIKATIDLKQTGWFGSQYYDNNPIRTKVPYNSDKLFPGYFEEDQLYNLEQDPLEQHNLAGEPEYKSILDEMKEKMKYELQKLPHPFHI